MRTALQLFQNANPMMLWLYGRKPSIIRAVLLSSIPVLITTIIAWQGDALFLRQRSSDGGTDFIYGYLEDYSSLALYICGVAILYGGKQIQLFLSGIEVADERSSSNTGVKIRHKWIRIFVVSVTVFCIAIHLLAQYYSPWFLDEQAANSWAMYPREIFYGWVAACVNSFWFFVVVFSIALSLIISCAFYVVPRVASSIRERRFELDPLHIDGMGGMGSLVTLSAAMTLTYVSAIIYIVVFFMMFNQTEEFFAATAVYTVLLPFVVYVPFSSVHRALMSEKKEKLAYYSGLHADLLRTGSSNSSQQGSTHLSLADVDAIHRRYSAMSTSPVSLRTIAITFPLLFPIARSLLEVFEIRGIEDILQILSDWLSGGDTK